MSPDALPYSELWGIAQGPDIIRQHVGSGLFIDEGAFQSDLESLIGCSQTGIGGGRLDIVSSASPGFFQELVEDRVRVKGLATRTTKLGFHILRLHYSCDPDKDPDTPAGKKWYAEARQNMSDARFRQEYELDYGALGGQRVFPDFEETLHVVEPRFPIKSDAMTVWLACDPHPRTAHAFLWAAVGKDGDIAVVWSSWRENAEKKLISEYAEMLHKADCHPFKLKPYRRIMDVAGKSFNADEERDIFQAYRDAKMRVEEGGKVVDKRIQVIFQPAKKDIGHVGLELINQALTQTLCCWRQRR